MSKLVTKYSVIFMLLAFCYAEPPRNWQTQRLRFPGPTNNRPFPHLAHQEIAPATASADNAPYPAAGFKPEPPFELPEQTYGPPEQTYGPPAESYGPPAETYGPPAETYGPPAETYGPPAETYGPPAETYGPPLPPPPPLVSDNNALPQSASIIAPSSNFFPQTQFALPLPERLIAFRPQRRPSAQLRRPNVAFRRPAAKLRRPQAQSKPAKLVLSFSS